MKTSKKSIWIWLVFAGVVLGSYSTAEALGLAGGGHEAPDPIPHEQLRQSSPGSWHYIYWTHGMRGK